MVAHVDEHVDEHVDDAIIPNLTGHSPADPSLRPRRFAVILMGSQTGDFGVVRPPWTDAHTRCRAQFSQAMRLMQRHRTVPERGKPPMGLLGRVTLQAYVLGEC